MKYGFFIIIYLFFSFSFCQAEEIIIVNLSVQEKILSLNEIRTIFSMKKKYWVNGSKISVYILNEKFSNNNSQVHNSFVVKKLQLLPFQLKRVWDRNIFSGTGEKPYKVNNEKEMLYKIMSTPGSIGYLTSSIELSDVNILKLSNVK
jgi:ABC-type phosphate transport system substrate-binding protein